MIHFQRGLFLGRYENVAAICSLHGLSCVFFSVTYKYNRYSIYECKYRMYHEGSAVATYRILLCELYLLFLLFRKQMIAIQPLGSWLSKW